MSVRRMCESSNRAQETKLFHFHLVRSTQSWMWRAILSLFQSCLEYWTRTWKKREKQSRFKPTEPIIILNYYNTCLVADIHIRCAPLFAAAPVAVALAVLDADAGDTTSGRRVHELVHQCRDGRIQDEGHEEEKGENTHDAHRAQDQARVVLDVLQPCAGIVGLGVHVLVVFVLLAGVVGVRSGGLQ